ncbi:MAG: biotin--[acetyl-CoA-carboxylase] ligase [Fimbriimonadales bacterium]
MRMRGRRSIKRIEWHQEIDSTQQRARALVESGNRRYDAVCADHQTAGRGRQGAHWHDTAGQSLLATLIVWDMPLPNPVGVVGVAAALAAAAALELNYPDLPTVRLKYPNDLLIDGRKLGGVLVEIVDGTAIVGLGVNLCQTVFPPELESIAISVAQACGHSERGQVPRAERASLIEYFHGFLNSYWTLWNDDPTLLRALWYERDDTIGRAYRVLDLPDQPIGTAVGISPKFELIVQLPNGDIRRTYHASAV